MPEATMPGKPAHRRVPCVLWPGGKAHAGDDVSLVRKPVLLRKLHWRALLGKHYNISSKFPK